MKNIFIVLFAILGSSLQAMTADGSTSMWPEKEVHVDLAPAQFEQHWSHIQSLLDSWEFEQAIGYAKSVKNLPEEWKKYLVANTQFELIIPEERCVAYNLEAARDARLPVLVRSRLYVMALHCRNQSSEKNDVVLDEIFSFRGMDTGYLQTALSSYRTGALKLALGYRQQGRGNVRDIVHHVIHNNSEHYYVFMSSFRVTETGEIDDIDIAKSWPEVHNPSRFREHMDFDNIVHSASPGERVIVYFIFTPFGATRPATIGLQQPSGL